MLSNLRSNFAVSLTLHFRHIQAYWRLIHPYLRLKHIKRHIKSHMLRDVKNPGIFRNILVQSYSDIF